jgi:hypothetical protein
VKGSLNPAGASPAPVVVVQRVLRRGKTGGLAGCKAESSGDPSGQRTDATRSLTIKHQKTAKTRRQRARRARVLTLRGNALRRAAADSHDRQIRSPVEVRQFEVELIPGLSSDKHFRQGAGRTTRPMRTRLNSRPSRRDRRFGFSRQ